MARKTETEKLTEAITALLKAVGENTATLKKALGQSPSSPQEVAEQVAKALSETSEPIPEDATKEEILEGIGKRLMPGIDPEFFKAEGKQELPLGDLGRGMPFQGLLQGEDYIRRRREDTGGGENPLLARRQAPDEDAGP